MTRVNIQNEYLQIQSYLNFKIIKCPVFLKQLLNKKNSSLICTDMENPEDFISNVIAYENKVKMEICQEINKIGININQSVKSINGIAKKSKLNKKDYEDLNTSMANVLLLQNELIDLINKKLFLTYVKEEL